MYLFACLLVTTMVTVGATHGMLSTGYRKIAEQYHTTFPEVVKSFTPPYVAAHAISLFFASAIAAVYGKRVQYVVGITILWLVMLAGFFANSLQYYSAINTIGGIANAPLELLMAPIVTDTIYIHQRGRIMALSAVVHVIGGDASHVIAGNIIAKLGVKYTYIISFGVLFPLVIMIYLFIWETTYTGPRPKPFKKSDVKTDESKSDSSSSELNEKADIQKIETVDTESFSKEDMENRYGANDPKMSWIDQLPVFRGRITDRSFVNALLQPFPLMIFPAVIFSTIVNGAFITWMVTSGLITFQVLAYPPYNLQPDTLAYIGLPGSAVGLIAAVFAGMFNDWMIKKLSKLNKGVYEPEFRLLAMIPGTLFTTLGFYLTGPAYANHYPVAKVVALGLLFHLGGPFAGSACITYIFDSHGHTTTEAFVATSLFKSVFIFFATQFVPKWFERVGAIKCYNTLALLNLGFSALTIPMYIYGKRLRGIVTRNDKLMKLARAHQNY